MKKRRNKPGLIFNIVSVCSFVLLLFFGAYLFNRNFDKKLERCSKYTIGKINTVRSPSMKSSKLVYSYTFDNQQTVGEGVPEIVSFDDWMRRSDKFYHSKWQGRRVWIQVNCLEPDLHRVLWNLKVSDTLKSIPISGWAQLPDSTSYNSN